MKNKNIIRVNGGYLTVTFKGSYHAFTAQGKFLGEAETFGAAVALVGGAR